MRQVVYITPARTKKSRPHRVTRLFGPTLDDLAQFLSIKYAINHVDMHHMLVDVFKYIDAEVMRNDERFIVARFGTFKKRHANSGGGNIVEALSITRAGKTWNQSAFTLMDDPEDAGPRY
ncbi:MAG: hypothetical protein KGI71_05705 [Patescibacteria group bacterium]|nr:hypothetical protein [Patescibacteria group bacterium]